ncbi:hypothetical protein J3E69DRAFT_171113 [Trichoderma sp. SZMC 28015]
MTFPFLYRKKRELMLLNLHISYSYFISACLSQINHVWLGKLLALACSVFFPPFFARTYFVVD